MTVELTQMGWENSLLNGGMSHPQVWSQRTDGWVVFGCSAQVVAAVRLTPSGPAAWFRFSLALTYLFSMNPWLPFWKVFFPFLAVQVTGEPSHFSGGYTVVHKEQQYNSIGFTGPITHWVNMLMSLISFLENSPALFYRYCVLSFSVLFKWQIKFCLM